MKRVMATDTHFYYACFRDMSENRIFGNGDEHGCGREDHGLDPTVMHLCVVVVSPINPRGSVVPALVNKCSGTSAYMNSHR